MIVPHAIINTLAANIIIAASETPAPKSSKTKKKETANPKPDDKETANPSESATDSGGGSGGESDPFGAILEFLLGNLWIPAIIAAIVGINIGWRRLTERQNLNGQPLSPLGDIIRRTLRLIFKEDKTPVFMRPQKFAMRMRWLTWQRYWFLAALAVVFDISAFSGIIPDQYEIFFTAIIILFILGGIKHIRLVFQRRHRILMQMFEVAAAECKYPKGSELNPWGWVQITKWNGLYSPAGTYVVFPPRVRSEDERFQQTFESNFASTVSSEHTWMYSWESANNRVLCEPVPFITDNAPYPFPDEHPWNEFPLGIAGGGKEAVVDVTTFPHILVAGTTGAGKASDNRTPIPVPVSAKYPSGWTNFGDIEIGDNVFDENGEKCRVVGISEVRDDFEMYRVSFSDGTFIDASGDHLWFTETRRTRESRWNAIRKKTERRSLISEDGLVALRNLLDGQTTSSELTIRQIADAAGVHETTTWLIDIANHLGPVGETQVVADFHYAEQTVKQTQKVTVYSAREAWHALASYQEQRRVPDWYANRAKYRALAESSTDTDVVSSKDLGKALGMSPQKAGALVRHKGIESWVTKPSGGRRAVLQFPARKSWLALATSQARGEGSVWAKNKSLFLTRLAESEPSAEITVVEIASAIGVSNTEVRGMLNRLGVPGRVEKREVELSVPARIVRRKSVIARTYLGQRFIKEVLSRAEVPAHSQEHKRDSGAVRTTLEIRDSLLTSSGSVNHSIPVAGALQLPEATLPIDPYTLGVWLGDGNSRAGNFSGIDCEIADYIAASGYCVTEKIPKSPPGGKNHDDFRLWKVEGLIEKLREENLLQRTTAEGSQKRIPPVYLRASITQRRMLLAGLLDTDGTVAPRGTVHFDNKNKLLAEQVLELARSLGYRATIISKRATLNGEDYGEAYRVAFACEESPFRLSRKTAAFIERTANHNPEKTTRRYVTDVQRIPSVPARCIMVDSPSRLFLAGEAMIPTHNSVTQRTLLLHALQSPDWRVSLIDPKRVELSAYTKHHNVVKVATELDESVALLEGVEKEMQSRYKRMEKEGVNHFKRLKSPPPAMMLMVDELFALLSPENIRSDEGKERDDMHARATLIIGSIARLGRAAGVHMILATQRPDAKVLPGETKALAIDTPILTIEGWKTIEQVRQGDYVFAPDGAPTQVTGVTEVMHDHECYELTFSDGSRITADAGHLWTVGDEGAPPRTTESLFQELQHFPDAHLSLPLARLSDAFLGLVGPLLFASPRYITQVSPVPSVPVKCIAVEHPSRLFLAGRNLIPTHNSNLDCRIAQGRMDTTPSLMVLDSEAATRIPKIKGRAMVRMGGEITEFQAYFLPEDSLTMVLEMSEALATEQMSVQDFKDLIEQARSGEQGKSGGRFRLPRIPVPRGVASRFSAWVERRKRAVEENEAEGMRFASKKAKSDPPMMDPSSSPSSSSSSGGLRGRLGRRGARGAGVPEEAVQRLDPGVESPGGSVRESGGLEGLPEPPGARGEPGVRSGAPEEDFGDFGEVHHEGDLGSEFEDEDEDDLEGFVFLEDMEEDDGEDFLPPLRQDSSRSDPLGSQPALSGVEGRAAVVGEEDEDDDIDLVFEDEDEDFLSPIDIDEDDFLDDIVDSPSQASSAPARDLPPAASPLPGVPQQAPRGPDPLPVPPRPVTPPPPVPVAPAEPVGPAVSAAEPSASIDVGYEDVGAPVAPYPPSPVSDPSFDEGAEDIFAAVTEAPWMPEAVSGSSGGPSPFGGGEFAAPSAPPPREPGGQSLTDIEDDDDEPFI